MQASAVRVLFIVKDFDDDNDQARGNEILSWGGRKQGAETERPKTSRVRCMGKI